jgi:hypothetical protein
VVESALPANFRLLWSRAPLAEDRCGRMVSVPYSEAGPCYELFLIDSAPNEPTVFASARREVLVGSAQGGDCIMGIESVELMESLSFIDRLGSRKSHQPEKPSIGLFDSWKYGAGRLSSSYEHIGEVGVKSQIHLRSRCGAVIPLLGDTLSQISWRQCSPT